MDKLIYVVSLGLDRSGSATRAVQFAALSAEKGAKVEVVLIDDAVHWAQFGMAEGIRTTTGEQMTEMIKKLVDNGGYLHVCKACADKRLIGPDDIIDGSGITDGPVIVDLLASPTTKVLTF